jgi:tetratricopeptide (TPR) repeat protein
VLQPFALLALAGALALPPPAAASAAPVRLWEQEETIPTYLAGPPDPNPMFHFGRQSQGAEGRIYPYPLYDNLTNQRGAKTYRMVYLENEYVRIGILPEIGGRLFSAVDKSNGYDFVYRQHVIKPALIGLIGAWISGGIEWNIPHHHRASTFLPVQWQTEEHADGGRTVWVGELEVRHRMRWAVGYTLRPGSAVLTAAVRILNRTPFLQTMLCFANVAVHANENYQIIFPPSTQWVTHHSKREFAAWPIARGRYGSADFGAGVDVSWYKNHLQANSMFAWNYADDFFAGYDHGRQAGTMCIADHHVVPGKKFWTWGSGPRGRMWDEILTDSDGPYIELMVGGYSDNQPDYSWLQPFETRAFEMSWYPFRDLGGVKHANLEAAVNLEVRDGAARIGFHTTRAHPAATARLVTAGGKVLSEERIAIEPGRPYAKQIPLPAGVDGRDLRTSLSAGGRELVAWAPLKPGPLPQPPTYTPPPAPREIANPEELVLAGQRADQFHSPTLDADPFWAEALRRDPGNSEAATGLGRLALRRAKFAEAEKHFRTALARLTANHTTPKNAEPLYHLGVALAAQGLRDAAVDAFQKAAWSQEWKAPAYFALAEIATARGDFPAALGFVQRSLDANALNVRAYGLQAAVLRQLDRPAEALASIDLGRHKTDPLDVRLAAERWLAGGDGADALFATLQAHPANALELAAEYANAGLWRDGAAVLTRTVAAASDAGRVSPLCHYYLGEFAERLGDSAGAADHRARAAAAPADYVFPFQWENIAVLRRAMAANPRDARAPYYLGNLLFDWQPTEAIALWEKSVALDPTFAIAWRNLAQAHAHQPAADARARVPRKSGRAPRRAPDALRRTRSTPRGRGHAGRTTPRPARSGPGRRAAEGRRAGQPGRPADVGRPVR